MQLKSIEMKRKYASKYELQNRRCLFTVNNRRLLSLFDNVLKTKNDSIAICTRASRRLNKR